MKSHKFLNVTAIAVTAAVICALALAVPAKAAAAEWLILQDTPQSYVFKVYSPGVTSQEADYCNFTIYSEPVVSGVGYETSWRVLLYINDGVTNHTWNKTLAVVNDAKVYANVSIANPAATFTEVNGTCDLTVRLQNGTSWAIVDTAVSTFGVYATEMSAVLGAFIPIIITVAIFAAIIPMIRKISGKSKR